MSWLNNIKWCVIVIFELHAYRELRVRELPPFTLTLPESGKVACDITGIVQKPYLIMHNVIFQE